MSTQDQYGGLGSNLGPSHPEDSMSEARWQMEFQAMEEVKSDQVKWNECAHKF